MEMKHAHPVCLQNDYTMWSSLVCVCICLKTRAFPSIVNDEKHSLQII